MLLFGISIAIRAPFLNRPLDNHHEWLTAQTLVIHSIWYQRGIAACGFNPIVTYGLAADKNIITPMGKIRAANGDYYYTSQPPFGYILPYLVLTSLGFQPGVLPLQIFNLVVHFLCVVLVFLIIEMLAEQRGAKRADLAAFAGAVVYIFTPATLWFHSNVYGFEILAQVFFLSGIYLFLRLLRKPSAILYAGLAATVFCMSYTEALGVLFTLTLVVYAFFHFGDRTVRKAAIVAAAGTAAALCLTLVQYSQIAGLDELVKRLAGTYTARSGLLHSNRGFSSIEAWQRVLSHYADGFGWLLLVAVMAAAVILGKKLLRPATPGFGKMEKAGLWLAIAPAMLHHLIFFNFTSIHDYSVLKDAVFISIFTGTLFYYLDSGWKRVFGTALVCSLALSVGQFWKINGNLSDCCKKTGELIAKTTKEDEVVFVSVPEESCAQVVYYAGRNIAEFWGEKDARELIRKNEAKRGIIFELDDDNCCKGYRYLED